VVGWLLLKAVSAQCHWSRQPEVFNCYAIGQVRAAVQLASDVEGLRLVLESALGRQYRVRVKDDGTVGLWRLR
jgi:hypothetical protein